MGQKGCNFSDRIWKRLANQFDNAEFYSIMDASLMPHEENPKEVLEIIKSKLN